ncbi:MAG: DUF4097 family beta strand repeat protein [Acidobacteriaceae bacterium]|nr:DUF4097 family beta strand repeat protein [Acidobacteriaceae bacterium]
MNPARFSGQMWMRAALLAAILVLSACDDFEGFDRARQDFHYSYPMQPGGHLDLENTNGSLEITGWDRSTIDISGTKYAPNDHELRDIEIKIDVTGNTARIHTVSPSFGHGSFGARYVLHLPRQVQLDRAKTTNGSVSIEDLEGGGDVRSTNGRITISRAAGNYDVNTTNGTIELEGVAGELHAETTNGSVRGQLKSGTIDANSTNGGIDFTISKPAEHRTVRAVTTNGGITLALEEFHDNPISAQTTNGPVTLRLPADTNAQLSAHTSSARITSDLPLSSGGDISKHEINGRLGNGGPQISLHTSTGGIHIEKF